MLVMSINLARGIRQRCKRLGMKVATLNGNGFDTLFRQPERQLVHLCSYTGGSPPLCWRLFLIVFCCLGMGEMTVLLITATAIVLALLFFA